MQKAQVVVEISEDGETKVEVSGHAGASCKKLTEAIEKALGSVEKDELKADYYQRSVSNQATQGR